MKPFCRENIDYIVNDERYTKKMTEIIKPGTLKAIFKLIEWKNFHKKHPENWNIKLDAENNDKLLVYNGKKWISADDYDIMQQLFDRLADDIDNFIGYCKENGIKLETKKFCEKLAKPMQFDMFHIDTEVQNYTLEMEDLKENYYDQTIEHIKILLRNSNG